MGFVASALFFGFVFFWALKTGLRTSKSRVYCSLRGSHYPKYFFKIWPNLSKLNAFLSNLIFKEVLRARLEEIANRPSTLNLTLVLLCQI